ncbi:MAG: prolyl oligopeptidase family serine peptidase [Bdellovibrionales bacterium]
MVMKTAPTAPSVIHLHGVDIPNPYPWLENLNAPETLAWIEGQRQRTERDIIDRKALDAYLAELTPLFSYPRKFLPQTRGDRKFFCTNTGDQAHNVLMVQDGDDPPRTLINPNHWTEKSRTLDNFFPSPDGRHVAFYTSLSYADWKTLALLDVETGQRVDGPFPMCRLPGPLAWRADSSGFIVARPTADPSEIARGSDPLNKLFEHHVGTDSTQDKLYYEPPEWARRKNMHVYCRARISGLTGDEFIFLEWGASAENAVYWRNPKGEWVELLGPNRGYLYPAANKDGFFYGITTADAPHGRIVRIDPANPKSEDWLTIIPEREKETLQDFIPVGDQILTVWRPKSSERVEAFSKTGESLGIVHSPELSTLALHLGQDGATHAHIVETSYRAPYIYHLYSPVTRKASFLYKPKILRDLTGLNIILKETEVRSADGTMVPMVLMYDNTKVKRNGLAKTKMHGYGAFGLTIPAVFNSTTMRQIEQGGIFACTHIRGGGDLGREWHLSARGVNKRKTYDDFIACAEYLIQEEYTSPERLESMGASNGGLLVLTCALQRKDLFGAAFADVPVTDLIRFTEATVGSNWIEEYGDPKNPDDFAFLLKTSPLHMIEKGKRYPALFINAGQVDERVVPWHAYKFVATMQELCPETPCYLNLMLNTGHMGAVGLKNLLEPAGIKECFSNLYIGPTPPDEYLRWKAANGRGVRSALSR